MLLAYSLHQLANDTNENHNYIAYLFISQTANADSSFDYLNYFLEQKLKKSKKNKLFVLSLTLNFQGNWNWRLGKIKRVNSDNSVVNSDNSDNRANFGVAPNSSSPSSSFLPSKIDTWYSHLPVCPAEQPTGRMEGEGAFHDKKTFLQVELHNHLFTLFEKIATHMLLTVKCFNNEFSDLYFSFRFYSAWWGRHIIKHLYFKSFWVFNKFFKY